MRTARAGVLLAVGFAFGAIPVAAEASAVNLATASPFVLLAGSSATNTGPSVLDGALGLSRREPLLPASAYPPSSTARRTMTTPLPAKPRPT